MVNSIVKTCSVCNESKPLSEYHKNRTMRDGHRPDCKSCRKIETSNYRKENKEKVLNDKKAWYRTTRSNAQLRTRAELNDGAKTCSVCKVVKDVLDFRERPNGGFYAHCRKCENLKNKEYAANNVHVIRRNRVRTEQRRREQAKLLTFDLTHGDWTKCKEYFENSCAYCGRKLKNLSQDHFVPLSKGGGYTKSNIIPCCRSCNSKKHNTDFDLWFPKQDFYSIERKSKILNYLNNLQ